MTPLVDNAPDLPDIGPGWHQALAAELQAPYFSVLHEFVLAERAQHHVCPPTSQVFAAFWATPFADVRVVIQTGAVSEVRFLERGAEGWIDDVLSPTTPSELSRYFGPKTFRKLARSRAQTIQLLRRRDRRLVDYLEATASSVTDLVLALDATSNLVFVSPSVAPLLGYEPAELIGQFVDVVITDALSNSLRGRLVSMTEVAA